MSDHSEQAKQLGIYGKDLIHNPHDKSFEGFIEEESPYQINFLDDTETEFCKKFYYDKVTSDGLKLHKSHFFLKYPLQFPELNEIIVPKLNKLFGEWFTYNDIAKNEQDLQQTADFYFWQQGIFAPHTDAIIHIPGYVPYKDVLIPLELEGCDNAPYYTFKQRWYGRGARFKYSHVDEVFTLYTDVIREKTYDQYSFFKNYEADPNKMISKEWYEQYFGIYNYEVLKGFSIDKMLPWTPGTAIVTDSSVIHGATNYNLQGGKYKLGITLRLFKKILEYNPSTIFSRYSQELQKFKEFNADPRSSNYA